MKSQPYVLELSFKRPLYSKMAQIKSGKEANTFIRENIEVGHINHKEYFWMILLTRSNSVLGLREISSGKTHATTISYKEIAQVAILANACACILVHNHPSGNLKPSSNDIEVTNRAEEVLQLLDVNLLDHIIITQEGYYSFVENDHITNP
jgi:DNA repair protein RadC